MNKEVYKNLIQEIYDEREILNNKKEEYTKEYIEANAEYSIGERVRIVTRRHPYWSLEDSKNSNEPTGYNEASERYAYVKSVSVDVRFDIKYEFFKEKLDGTVSKKADYYNQQFEYIEKL